MRMTRKDNNKNNTVSQRRQRRRPMILPSSRALCFATTSTTTTATTTISIAQLLLAFLFAAAASTHGWTISSSSSRATTNTATFYKNSATTTVTADELQPPTSAVVTFDPTGSSTTTTTTTAAAAVTKKQRQPQERIIESAAGEADDDDDDDDDDDSFDPSVGGKLPWLDDRRREDDGLLVGEQQPAKEKNEPPPCFLPHWDWQLSHFERHLMNLRRNNHNNHKKEEKNGEDLSYLAADEGTKKIYTLSLKSDEYRDIRMTYMSVSGKAEMFRCLCYPKDKRIPILGMGLMQFDCGTKNDDERTTTTTRKRTHLAVMDYQPTLCDNDDNENEENVQASFETELMRIRSGIPSMTSPMTHRHFDSSEERKHFTDIPLIGKWKDEDDNGAAAVVDHRAEELVRAQREFVRSHVRLTQQQQQQRRRNNGNNDAEEEEEEVLRLHSEFDKQVSSKEPAGPFLKSAFGKEIGEKLVREMIFPLSGRDNGGKVAASKAKQEQAPVPAA